MQKLMKLVIIVLIFCAVILAAPFGMGIVTEREMYKKVKEFQVKLAHYPNIEYKLVSFKRGFFRSEAEERFIFKNIRINGQESQPIELVIIDEIKHGPFIFGKDTAGKPDFWVGRAAFKGQLRNVVSSGSIQPLPIDLYMGYIHFNGDIKLVVDINKLSVDFPTFSLAFENLKNVMECSSDHKEVNNQLDIKQVLFTDKIKPQKIDLKGLSVTTDLTKNNQGIWLGSRKVEINALTAFMDGKTYAVKGLYNKTQDVEHDKQVKFEVMLNIQSAGEGDTFYGPHRLVLETDGMDASILSHLSQTLIQLDHENLTRTDGVPANLQVQTKNQMLLNKMSDLGADLIKKGFSIEVKSLEIATKWGTLIANSRFKIPNLSGQQQAVPQFSLLSSILNMETTLNAQIPAGLAKKIVASRYRKMLESQNQSMPVPEAQSVDELADKHLAKLVADGWFIPKGAAYEIGLSFKNGTFLVNDKPLKPQGILPELTSPTPPSVPLTPMLEGQGVTSPIDALSPESEKTSKHVIQPAELHKTGETQVSSEKKSVDENTMPPSTSLTPDPAKDVIRQEAIQ